MRFFKQKSSESVPRRRVRDVEQQRQVEPTQIYRRNRTITGSRSTLFGSAAEHRSDMTSPRAEVHDLAQKRNKIVRVLGVILAVSALLLVLLWHFIASYSLRATDGVQISNQDQYKRVLNDYLLRQPLQRFRISLDQDQLTNYMAAQLPEVEKVQLRGVSGLGSSEFELTMRKPVAQWSVDGVDKFVDSNGVSFSANYYNVPFIQVIDNSGISPTSGAAVASSRFLGYVGRVVTVAQQNGYKLTSVTIPLATTRQIEVKLEGVPYAVKMSVDRPVGEQVEDMSRAIVYLSQNGQSPQYIDVRISGRAYYK